MRLIVTEKNNSANKIAEILSGGQAKEDAVYKVHWTTHQHAAYSWRGFVQALRKVGYSGAWCLPAEYSHPSGKGQRMGDEVLPSLRGDIAYLKGLLGKVAK